MVQDGLKNIRRFSAQLVIGAVVFLSFFANSDLSFASSSSSSWSQQPSWANEPRSSSHRSVLKAQTQDTTDFAPFAPSSHNIALDLGQVFLMGDLGKYSDSIGTQVHYTYGVSDLFGFDTSLGYSRHSNNQFSMTTLLTGMRMNL